MARLDLSENEVDQLIDVCLRAKNKLADNPKARLKLSVEVDEEKEFYDRNGEGLLKTGITAEGIIGDERVIGVAGRA